MIARIETTNETTIPSISAKNSPKLNAKPNLTSFKSEAPNITGIARKNVNSAETYLDAPKIIPPRIVAPERDVPGTSANT